MKLFRIFLLLATFCAAGPAVRAQDAPGSSPLQFKEESWDFGQIKEANGSVSHVFTFTNRGQEPFVIKRVATTCGCTTPEYSREPILPGRNGTVKVTFDPAGRPGPFSKTITVTLHSNSQSKVTITGTVEGKPRNVNDEYPVVVGEGLRTSRQTAGMGYLPQGGTRGSLIQYLNSSGVPITLDVDYDQPHGYFEVTFSPKTLPPGGKGVMTLSYDLRNQTMWGRITDHFRVTVNGVRTQPVFQATGIVTEDFSGLSQDELSRAPRGEFTAQYYHFGDTKAGEKRSRDFTITNAGQEPLVIRSVTPGERTTITLAEGTTLAPGASLTFTATLDTEGRPAGRFTDNTTIIINDPQRPMRELRLAATIY